MVLNDKIYYRYVLIIGFFIGLYFKDKLFVIVLIVFIMIFIFKVVRVIFFIIVKENLFEFNLEVRCGISFGI